MIVKVSTKTELEEALKGKGDYVQIDYLSRLLETKAYHEAVKKLIYMKLAELYEKKSLYLDAAKLLEGVATTSTSSTDKMNFYLKAAEMYIKGSAFSRVDEILKRSLSDTGSKERENLHLAIKNFYRMQGEIYEKTNRRNHAVKIYEKLLDIRMPEAEKQEIKEKLLKLYENLGKLKEYFAMKGGKEVKRR